METSLSDPQIQSAIVLGGLAFLLGIANQAVSLWKSFRRTPSLDQELNKYATKAEVLDLRREVTDITRQLFDRQREDTSKIMDEIKSLTSQLSDWQRGLERQVGRIEGNCQKHTKED